MKWRHSVASMFELISAICSWFVCQFRSRTELALEVVVLRHQLNVLRRQRPGRPRLRSFDRLLWVWLYRLWQRRLKSIALVKPATIVQWHRQGFRLFWRWRSRSGRPPVNRELRKLIREMSKANPLWGAPRIHGELLKLALRLARPRSPSTWSGEVGCRHRLGGASYEIRARELPQSICSSSSQRRFGSST